jgi:hypothetical protein
MIRISSFIRVVDIDCCDDYRFDRRWQERDFGETELIQKYGRVPHILFVRQVQLIIFISICDAISQTVNVWMVQQLRIDITH